MIKRWVPDHVRSDQSLGRPPRERYSATVAVDDVSLGCTRRDSV
jgi:hypothetical protein